MSDDIDALYESLRKEYGDGDDSSDEECLHLALVEDSGVRVCQDCGLTDEVLDFEPEWRNYGGESASRCCSVRGVAWSLEKDFIKWDISVSPALRTQTEHKYLQVMEMVRAKKDKKSGRGRGRKAIIAACLLFVLRETGDCRTFDELKNMFKLSKKNMFNGLTAYYERFKTDRTQYVTPEDLIARVLVMTGIDKTHYSDIVLIAKELHNTSRTLNRSKPLSVASATVYFWLCLNPSIKTKLGLTRRVFAEMTKLSDITIAKHVKEMARVAGCDIKL